MVISICLELIRGQRQDILPENLFLISPWVDLFSIAPSYARNADADLIDQQWLSDSKHQYLGPTMSELGTQFCRLQTAEYLSRVLSHSTMNVQVVVFDMDQCLVARHSMGRLRIGSDLVDYLSRITPDFVVLAKALHKRGIRLAIATHSDSVEYDAPFRSRATHIIGDDLAKAVLSHSLPELADSFHIVAWNPSARGNNKDQDSDKKRYELTKYKYIHSFELSLLLCVMSLYSHVLWLWLHVNYSDTCEKLQNFIRSIPVSAFSSTTIEAIARTRIVAFVLFV